MDKSTDRRQENERRIPVHFRELPGDEKETAESERIELGDRHRQTDRLERMRGIMQTEREGGIKKKQMQSKRAGSGGCGAERIDSG